ncbi:MAG TPA: arabinose transporter [Beijerinckiaceae bacterium]|nr:arabinose transporter [Beijerinckiaceae bacterium]
MSAIPLRAPARAAPSVLAALLPIMAMVLIAFLVIGVAMPVLPLHVRDGLGFGPFMVGVVAGAQFAASLLARLWSGGTADRHGPKQAVIIGLWAATAAGLLYFLSLSVVGEPRISVAILLAGRAVLGAAESFIITGATAWGLARVGAENAGKVIAWIGTAMFAAFAGGAPLGAALYGAGGFAAVASATALAPLATLLIAASLQGAAPTHQRSPNVLSVLRRIWVPGVGAALSSIGFGAIIAFASLLFAERGWAPVWLPFSAYAAALIAARLLFGHLPDRVGGAKVALVSVIEAAGLALVGLASSAAIAALGAAFTGLGYALVFPGFGVEAVRRAPPESRGTAMGAYTACLDLALGVSGPALGGLAAGAGLGAAFIAAALTVLCAAVIAARLLRAAPFAG